MSGLKGKFIRRQGTAVIFGSRNKPEWKPIDLSGQFHVELIPDRYYELTIENRRLVDARELPPMSGGGGSTYSDGQASSGPPAASGGGSQGGVPLNGLMASATGFAKSAMESGICKTVEEAEAAGLRWASRWGSVPTPQSAPQRPTEAPEAPNSPPPPHPIEIDDEIPF